ncbi:MAG: hypothetical protein KA436_06650 [Oligoflexales bacterium]|nr:hypothetical protein [Oligoflexales bacterium]
MSMLQVIAGPFIFMSATLAWLQVTNFEQQVELFYLEKHKIQSSPVLHLEEFCKSSSERNEHFNPNDNGSSCKLRIKWRTHGTWSDPCPTLIDSQGGLRKNLFAPRYYLLELNCRFLSLLKFKKECILFR